LFHARVAHAGPRWVAGQDAEEKKIQYKHKQDRKERPGNLIEQIFLTFHGVLPAR
jgi:hypothetical protein